MSDELLSTPGCRDGLVPDVSRYRRGAGGFGDELEFVGRESEVDVLGSRVVCGWASASFGFGHVDDYTVKQKRVDMAVLMPYDKDMTSAAALRTKFNSMIATRNLDQAIAALTINDESTGEGMMIRVALIAHIEKLSPAIAAWVSNFYGEDFTDNEDVDYRDAILLAREAVNA